MNVDLLNHRYDQEVCDGRAGTFAKGFSEIARGLEPCNNHADDNSECRGNRGEILLVAF